MLPKVVRLSVCALALVTAPAAAETLEELDALAQTSQDEALGIQLAQQQAARGEFLDALATLERVLAVHPKSDPARLLHAVYLCRVDDKLGAAVEFDKLRRKKYSDAQWADALAQCGFSEAGN
jgi:predicted Zn-dependent protease